MRFKETAIGAAVLILLLSIWWTAGRWYERTLVEEQRLRVLAASTPYGNSLTTAINRRLLLLEGLKNFAIVRSRSGKDIDPVEFSTFAAGMYSVSKGIRVIHLSPGGVNRYVFPLEGNEAVSGHDLLHDQRPQVRQDVQRTIQTRRIALSDPYELRQGGMGLVARLAIYRKDDFWGLAVIILVVPPILNAAGLDQRLPGLELAIRDRAHRVFFGREEVFASQPIIYTVALPEGSWQMAATPAGGWKAAVSGRLRLFQGVGLFIVGLLFSLAFLVASRQRSLTQAIAERTLELERELAQRRQKERDLQESEERFRAIASNTPDHIIIQDSDLRYSFVINPQLGLTEADMIGKTDREILGKEEAENLTALKRKVLETGTPVHLEASLKNRHGETEFFEGDYIPKWDSTGRVDGLIGYFRNVTARKRADDEIRRLNSELEQRVMERTAELEAKIAEIERMNRLFVGRELRMAELKERIRELEEKTGTGVSG